MNDPQMADHCGSSSPTALARRKKCSEGCPKMQVKSSEKKQKETPQQHGYSWISNKK
jgi:hypothetical protein